MVLSYEKRQFKNSTVEFLILMLFNSAYPNITIQVMDCNYQGVSAQVL